MDFMVINILAFSQKIKVASATKYKQENPIAATNNCVIINKYIIIIIIIGWAGLIPRNHIINYLPMNGIR